MRHSTIIAIALAANAHAAYAEGFDIYGGADNSTQTVAHCGFLPTHPYYYTDHSNLNTRIVQNKLAHLGYYQGGVNGVYGAASKQAVIRFQADYGLKPDGIVGPLTAQRLAYVAHPSRNVQRCWREANFR